MAVRGTGFASAKAQLLPDASSMTRLEAGREVVTLQLSPMAPGHLRYRGLRCSPAVMQRLIGSGVDDPGCLNSAMSRYIAESKPSLADVAQVAALLAQRGMHARL